MSKFSAIINHIKNGTLFDRLLNNKKHRLFREYSDFLVSNKEYIEKKISDKITIRLFKNANLSKELYCYGFEESEIKFFKRYLKPGDVVIDIGANIGLFTLIASEGVNSSGKVFAFEPSPQTYTWLTENIKANTLSNVLAFKSALSDKNGTIDFYVSSQGYDAFNSVVKPSKGDYTKESVPTQTLDSFIKEQQLERKVRILKIDVEGFEIPLLSGATDLLTSDSAPDMIVEFTESNAKNAGVSCSDLYDKITSFGYALYQYDYLSNKLVPEKRGMDYTKYRNLIATKNVEAIKKRLQADATV